MSSIDKAPVHQGYVNAKSNSSQNAHENFLEKKKSLLSSKLKLSGGKADVLDVRFMPCNISHG